MTLKKLRTITSSSSPGLSAPHALPLPLRLCRNGGGEWNVGSLKSGTEQTAGTPKL